MHPGTASRVMSCPTCGSPSVVFSSLDGGGARCDACDWAGSKSALLVSPFQQTVGGTDGELLQKFEQDARTVLAKDLALPVARLLTTWGFLYGEDKEKVVLVGRYMKSIGRAVVLAILEERRLIEHERASAQK